MSDIAVAALLAGTILVASTISVEVGLSVALVELFLGVVVGNAFHLDVPSWLSFLGSFAGMLLTFQAGAEVDVPQFRREWKASLSIGLASFFAPLVVVGLLARYGLGWDRRQAEIGGLALSTTSLLIAGLPRISPWFFRRYGNRVIEPEIKLVFAALFVLMWLGGRASSQAALPAFILGLTMSNHYAAHRVEQERMRVVAFSFLTPFFFLKGGMNVSAGALWANLGILALLFVAKMAPKFGAVYPPAQRYTAPHGTFTTLLMSTGLTFGTITSLYGLNAGIIGRTQFSLLIAVVVLSAIIPTAVAQRLFHPHAVARRPDEPVPAEVI